jgi:hypothetical protein
MKASISSSFWSDSDIEKHGPEIKLASLWLITNGQTSLIGICSASAKRFSFETGLPPEWLERTIQGLPESFIRFGEVIFIPNFIRHQFGTGESLKKNNYFKAMTPLFCAIKNPELAARVLSEYPEFEGLPKGFLRASQAQEQSSIEKSREESGERMQGEGGNLERPPGYPSSAEDAVTMMAARMVADPPHPDFVRSVWDQADSRGGRDGGHHQIVNFGSYVSKRWRQEKGEWLSKQKTEKPPEKFVMDERDYLGELVAAGIAAEEARLNGQEGDELDSPT